MWKFEDVEILLVTGDWWLLISDWCLVLLMASPRQSQGDDKLVKIGKQDLLIFYGLMGAKVSFLGEVRRMKRVKWAFYSVLLLKKIVKNGVNGQFNNMLKKKKFCLIFLINSILPVS